MYKFGRKMVLAMSVLLAFLMLPSHGAGAGTAQSTSGITTIRYLVMYPEYQPIYDSGNIIAEYKKVNPKVKLEIEYKAYNYPDVLRKTDEASGKFDIVMVPAFKGTMEANADLLEPLDNLTAVKNNMFAKAYTVKGKVLGIPAEAKLELVWYRKSIFDEYKLKVPNTWDEFIAAAKKIRDKGKYTPIAMGSKDYWSSGMLTNSLMNLKAVDSSYKDMMLNESEPFVEGKPFYEGLKCINELVSEKLFGKNPSIVTDDDTLNLFKAKKAAMIYYKDFIQSKSYTQTDVGSFFLPVRKKATDRLYAMANMDTYMLMSKESKNKKEVFDFINWHFSDKWYPKLVDGRGYMSAQKNIRTNYRSAVKDAFKNAGNNVYFLPSKPETDMFGAVSQSAGISFDSIGQKVIEGKNFAQMMTEFNTNWKRSREVILNNEKQDIKNDIDYKSITYNK